jgi:hypothetical protein
LWRLDRIAEIPAAADALAPHGIFTRTGDALRLA